MKNTKSLLWLVLISSIIIMVYSVSDRIIKMTPDLTTNVFHQRYIENSLVSILHLVPGLLLILLSPIQLIKSIRQRYINLHRLLGRILVLCALITGISGIIAALIFPAYGGVSTQAATIFFGIIFIFSLVKAIFHIRKKEIQLHREWMIRMVSIAMGVASIRVIFLLFIKFTNYSYLEIMGTTFWIGWSINLIIAETYIRYTQNYQ